MSKLFYFLTTLQQFREWLKTIKIQHFHPLKKMHTFHEWPLKDQTQRSLLLLAINLLFLTTLCVSWSFYVSFYAARTLGFMAMSARLCRLDE